MKMTRFQTFAFNCNLRHYTMDVVRFGSVAHPLSVAWRTVDGTARCEPFASGFQTPHNTNQTIS